MNRREFLTVLSATTALPAVSMFNVHAAVAASETTSLYVKGLVMMDFENPEVLRLGFPKAPGHKATLSIVPQNGSRRILTIKGRGAVEAPASASGNPRISVPELVRMKECYAKSVKSQVDKCHNVNSHQFRA